MTPGPFERAFAIGSNISGAAQDVRDRGALDEILMRAASKDGYSTRDAMSDILSRVRNKDLREGAIRNLEQREAADTLLEKEQAKSQADAHQMQAARQAYDRIKELVPSVGFVKSTTRGVYPDTDKAFGEFQTLVGGLEGAIREMVNTGRITDSQFKYITQELLPKPNDRQAVIRGKLEAVAKLLGFDDVGLVEVQEQTDETAPSETELTQDAISAMVWGE